MNDTTAPEIRHITTAHKQKIAARRKQAMEWRKAGYLLREIAAAYGVSEALICRDIKFMEREERKQRARTPRPSRPPLPRQPKTKSA